MTVLPTRCSSTRPSSPTRARQPTSTSPVVDLEQRSQRVSLVIGPSSQLMAEPVAAERELKDEAFTDKLVRRTRVLQSKSGTFDGGDLASFENLDGL